MQRPASDTERPHTLCWSQFAKTVMVIFVTAVFFNYPWELVQAPLYMGMEQFRTAAWHCFMASLGDGLLVLIILAAGWVGLHRYDWFVHPGVQGYGVMLMTGLVLGIAIEWISMYLLGRWMYTAQMPLVPGLDVGVVPIVQMLILPPVIFRLVAVWHNRTAGAP